MANEHAKFFLSEDSLEALAASKGATILVQFPKEIEETQTSIDSMKNERADCALQIEGMQKGYEDLFKLPFMQRLFNGKKIKEEKAEYIKKIGDLATKITSLDSLISDHETYIKSLKSAIDEFVKALANVGVKPQDVVEEYHRIKDVLERKARGEYVEEVAPIVDESASVVEEISAEKDAIPAQNKKANPRLSQREKFERRLVLSMKKSTASDPTYAGKQPGEN